MGEWAFFSPLSLLVILEPGDWVSGPCNLPSLHGPLRSLHFYKEMPFFFFFWTQTCLSWGCCEQSSVRTELLSHTFCSSACTGFLGPALKCCLRTTPAILCRNVILHLCIYTAPPSADGAVRSHLVINTDLRNTLELIQSLVVKNGACLTSGKGSDLFVLFQEPMRIRFYGFWYFWTNFSGGPFML